MCELLFQKIKGGMAVTIEIPEGLLAGKPCKRDNNVRVAMNETPIEVTKTLKGLNILNLTRFWPIQNDLNLVRSHAVSVGADHKAEVFNTSLVELAFRGRGVKSVLA